jgi:hypothetical protein
VSGEGQEISFPDIRIGQVAASQEDVLNLLGLVDLLDEKIAKLKHNIHYMNEAFHRKNLELDALHFVWCTARCTNGFHRYHKDLAVPSDEEIATVARVAIRLVTRFPSQDRNTQLLRSWLQLSYAEIKDATAWALEKRLVEYREEQTASDSMKRAQFLNSLHSRQKMIEEASGAAG